MKKIAVAARWLFAIGFVVLFSTNIAEASAPLLDRTSLSGLALELKTPENIAKYMWRHFLFEPDQRQFGKSEYWQSAEELLKNGKGDCEDFALFAKELLQLNGLNSFLLNIYSNGSGHTVCVFELNGEYSVIDGTNIIHTKSTDLKQIMTEINPFWQFGAVVSASSTSHDGRILTTLTR